MSAITGRLASHTNAFVLGIYLFIIEAIRIYLLIGYNEKVSLLLMLILAAALVFISPVLLKAAGKISIPERNTAVNKKQRLICFCSSTLVILAVLLISFAAWYPGSFSPDSATQYEQAISGEYNNWHPVIHTLLAFTLPLKLTGGSLASIVGFQIVTFSLALGYMGYTLWEYSSKKTAIIVLLYILLNPTTIKILVYPWKDVAFAMFAILLVTLTLKIYLSRGQWLMGWKNTLSYSAVLVLATLMRHNAILFTLPVLVFIVFYISRKQWLFTILASVTLYAIITLFTFSLLKVEAPDKRNLETLGLPLTVMGNAVKECPERLDTETLEFLYAIAPQEKWEEQYHCGNFNDLKWHKQNVDLSIVDETSRLDILKMTLNCFIRAPGASLRGLFTLTRQVYAVNGPADDILRVGDAGVVGTDRGNLVIRELISRYEDLLCLSPLFYLFYFIGSTTLILLICILGKSDLRSTDDWKRIALCSPMFFYNFGTMLLLTGPDSRFFYYSFTVCPIFVFIMLFKRKDSDTVEEKSV